MQGHLAAVAVGSARTELSANIRLMGRFFEQGVPADDDTCVRMMRALPSCGECGEIDLDITDVFKLELSPYPPAPRETWTRITAGISRSVTRMARTKKRSKQTSLRKPRQATAEWA